MTFPNRDLKRFRPILFLGDKLPVHSVGRSIIKVHLFQHIQELIHLLRKLMSIEIFVAVELVR